MANKKDASADFELPTSHGRLYFGAIDRQLSNSLVNFQDFATQWVLIRFFFGEFDPGSERTLAAGFIHASRAIKAPSGVYKAANG